MNENDESGTRGGGRPDTDPARGGSEPGSHDRADADSSAGLTLDDRVIVALDLAADDARALADSLRGRVRWLKVGMTLFYEAGPQIVDDLREKGFDVFVDLKLYDIPHQVAGAAANIARLGAGMFTVHASGGLAMMRAAVESARRAAEEVGLPAPAVLAVTVLTSMDDVGLAEVGIGRPAREQVRLLAGLARDAGVDGVVCSPREAAEMRGLLGEQAVVVTPGVRPQWSETGDQARVATPAEAFGEGASYVVIGRPVLEAPVPAEALARVLGEIERAGQ
jgi:orotidine-5'-phosphate decarboxylase